MQIGLGLSITAQLRFGSSLSSYAVNDFDPSLVFDFEQNYYRTGGTDSTLSSSVTHAATSNATMIDSDGLLKWRPHNLLTYSEDFSDASWSKTAINATANSITEDTSTSFHGLRNAPLTATINTFEVEAKEDSGRYLIVTLGQGNTSLLGGGVVVDLQTGTTLTASGAKLLDSSISPVSDGYHRIKIRVDNTGASNAPFAFIFMTKDPAHVLGTTYGSDSYTGDGVSTILLRKASAYRSDLGGMVNNPETGDSYVRTAGRPIGPELVTNGTFDTDTTGWTPTACSVSVVNGAMRITDDDGSIGYVTQRPILEIGKVYLIQMDVVTDNMSGNMILNVGTSSGSGQLGTLTLPSVGTYSFTFTATVEQPHVNLRNTNAVAGDYWDVDNISVKEIDVDPATARYLPRVGHHIYNGDAWVNEGVLHESEARTNLVTQSNVFTTLGASTVTVDSGISPTGETNAVLADTVSSSTSNGVYLPSYNVTPSTSCTVSFYVKNVAGNGILAFFFRSNNSVNQTKLWFNLNTGEKGTQGANGGTTSVSDFGITEVGNGWYRVYAVGTDSGQTTINPFIFSANSDNSNNRDASGELLLFGVQAEAGSTPSSYIPTSGSTVTRAAETLTVPAANMPWPETVYASGELVTNGTFDSNINDWTLSDANGTIVWDASGAISLTGGSGTVYASQPFTTVSGRLYELNITGPSSGNIHLAVGTSENNQSLLYTAVTGTKTFTFIASSTTTYVTFREFSGTGPTLVSNVSIKEINPLSVSIQMDGRMTYADTGSVGEAVPFRWFKDGNNFILNYMRTDSTRSGSSYFQQEALNVSVAVESVINLYSPDINVPFNIASRHGSTFINGAVEGTALTANTTPTSLPDLSATNLTLGSTFMGTIGKFRMWSDDLTDTGIATASAPSTEPSLQLTFDGLSTSSFTVLDWSE